MYPSIKYPHYGIFVKNTYDLLLDNGYTVDKVVMFKTDNKVKKVFNYLRFYVESFLKSLWNNYDYIYVHFISHSTLGVILPYRFSKNTKLILNVHGNDVIADNDYELKNEKRSRKYLCYATKVIVPSNYFKNVIKEKYNVKSNKIIVYPSGGVDVNKFKKINKKTALKNASLKDDIKYFGYVSRIEKDKGYDTLVLAINELKKQKKLKGIKFLIIGSGSEDNILDKLIEEYKLKKYIERRPFATQDELVNIYNSLVALIYPTRRKSESLGLTGLEALASEALVIGSNKYGPSDYLIDNENSITFNPEDYEELAKKIEGTLKLKVRERNRLTKNGREKALEYSLENTKDNLLNVFKK
jgi:glycosyltransferase involved in cell wall biosynthesis